MRARKNVFGFFEFSIEIRGCKGSKLTKGIIDTGSHICASTHKIITALWLRPIDHTKISAVGGASATRLIYEVEILFEGKSSKCEIARLSTLPDNIDLILGLSFLEKFNWQKTDNHIDITWK